MTIPTAKQYQNTKSDSESKILRAKQS